MVRWRAGTSRLGCLFTALIVAAIAYFGVDIGEIYLRFYRYRDAMQQEARFAGQRDDTVIRQRLHSIVDSLGLPPEAANVKVSRTGTRITISASYHETLVLPFYERPMRFKPSVSRGL